MAESSSVKKENLRKTLDLLQRKLVQTHAEVRRVRRTVRSELKPKCYWIKLFKGWIGGNQNRDA